MRAATIDWATAAAMATPPITAPAAGSPPPSARATGTRAIWTMAAVVIRTLWRRRRSLASWGVLSTPVTARATKPAATRRSVSVASSWR